MKNSSKLLNQILSEDDYKQIFIPSYLAIWFDCENKLSAINLVDDTYMLPFVSINVNFDLNKYSIDEPDFNEICRLVKIAPIYEEIFDSLEFILYDDTIHIWYVYKLDAKERADEFIQLIYNSCEIIDYTDDTIDILYDISEENPFDFVFNLLRMFAIHVKI